MEKIVRGKAFIMGDNVNTDIIIPNIHMIHTDPKELGRHAFSVMGEEYTERLKSCDIIIAGDNFGCGSSREQAAIAIKGMGIKVVIARSFARIFFRNAINSGLPAIECSEIYNAVAEGDEITVDFYQYKVLTQRGNFCFSAMPESISRILEMGGLVECLKSSLAK